MLAAFLKSQGGHFEHLPYTALFRSSHLLNFSDHQTRVGPLFRQGVNGQVHPHGAANARIPGSVTLNMRRPIVVWVTHLMVWSAE